ncbi:MAG: hypothetical protein ABIQ44_06885 [Chloroflexia bacterium]
MRFYLHEDDWGMITVMPAENLRWARRTMGEASAFGEAHKAEDGVGWTDMYVIPAEEHSISEKGISLEALRKCVAGRLVEADEVSSGYSSYVEEVKNGFAFGESGLDKGAFYGNVDENGMVVRLEVVRPDWEDEEAVVVFGEMLEELGKRYELMLADWWWDVVVDLRDDEAIGRYLRAQ